ANALPRCHQLCPSCGPLENVPWTVMIVAIVPLRQASREAAPPPTCFQLPHPGFLSPVEDIGDSVVVILSERILLPHYWMELGGCMFGNPLYDPNASWRREPASDAQV